MGAGSSTGRPAKASIAQKVTSGWPGRSEIVAISPHPVRAARPSGPPGAGPDGGRDGLPEGHRDGVRPSTSRNTTGTMGGSACTVPQAHVGRCAAQGVQGCIELWGGLLASVPLLDEGHSAGCPVLRPNALAQGGRALPDRYV